MGLSTMLVDSNEPNTVMTIYALLKEKYNIQNVFAADYMANI